MARALGGKRVSAPYRPGPDVVSGDGRIVCDCKHRKALPVWLASALARVRGQAVFGALGVVILHAAGEHDSIVCVSLKDWRAWYGELPKGADDDHGV
jgi:hypothetical protein